jgi:hypothetical protein
MPHPKRNHFAETIGAIGRVRPQDAAARPI